MSSMDGAYIDKFQGQPQQQHQGQVADPWTVTPPRPKYAALPEQAYVVSFQGWEDYAFPPKDKDDGLRWRWHWRVETGPHAGVATNSLTKRDLSVGGKAWGFAKVLIGHEPQVGESVRDALAAAVGTKVLGTVKRGPQGGQPEVRDISPLPPM